MGFKVHCGAVAFSARMATARSLGLFRGSRVALKLLPNRSDASHIGRTKSTLSETTEAAKASVAAPQLPPHSLLPNKILLRSLLVATISSRPWLLMPALKMLQDLVRAKTSLLDVDKNPVLRTLLKRTFYNHFCAGENKAEVISTIGNIKEMGFKGVILTYAREIVVEDTFPASESANSSAIEQSSEAELSKNLDYKAWREGVLETVGMVGKGDILALKLTGAGEPVMKALLANQPLPDEMMNTLQEICSRVIEQNARIFIDAEQQSVQAGIDAVALDLMRQYNAEGTAIVFNTYQAYLKSTPGTVEAHLEIAEKEGFTLGVKLVRGAYINSEPRALINDTKSDTDDSYNSIAASIIGRRYGVYGDEKPFPSSEPFLATHNRESVLIADRLVQERLSAGLSITKVQYGQLLGMADGVSCKLLQLGKEKSHGSRQAAPEVFKCLSWGTLGDCLSYLLRRAVENQDAVGRTKEEYIALRQDTFRRLKRGFAQT